MARVAKRSYLCRCSGGSHLLPPEQDGVLLIAPGRRLLPVENTEDRVERENDVPHAFHLVAGAVAGNRTLETTADSHADPGSRVMFGLFVVRLEAPVPGRVLPRVVDRHADTGNLIVNLPLPAKLVLASPRKQSSLQSRHQCNECTLENSFREHFFALSILAGYNRKYYEVLLYICQVAEL